MVGLQAAVGDFQGAIQLEGFWNELAERRDFSLYCAYPAAVVVGADRRDALHEICDLHSDVVPVEGVGAGGPLMQVMPLRADREACARARRFVRSTLRMWGHSGFLVEHAMLVCSELAANAVVHAGSAFSVELHAQADALRVSVSDRGPAPGEAWAMRADHGLGLIDALCARWGVTGSEHGKTVWAELPMGGLASG
jgi:hypothetical protein